MLAALESLRGEFSFAVEVVDIDACPAKLARYDQRVPVLTFNDEEICNYFFDSPKVREVLGRFR
jgi:hypothetical protein